MIDQLTVREYEKEDTKVLPPLDKQQKKMNCKVDSEIFLLIQLTVV